MKENINSVAKFYNSVKFIYTATFHLFFNKGRNTVANDLNKSSCLVLDIGCNEGQLAKTLTANVTYLGIDVADKCINNASLCFKDANNINFSILNGENS